MLPQKLLPYKLPNMLRRRRPREYEVLTMFKENVNWNASGSVNR